jgi:hypothetical protein
MIGDRQYVNTSTGIDIGDRAETLSVREARASGRPHPHHP